MVTDTNQNIGLFRNGHVRGHG